MKTFPDFTAVPFHAAPAGGAAAPWQACFEHETAGKSWEQCVQPTLEGIDIRPLYTAADLQDFQIALQNELQRLG